MEKKKSRNEIKVHDLINPDTHRYEAEMKRMRLQADRVEYKQWMAEVAAKAEADRMQAHSHNTQSTNTRTYKRLRTHALTPSPTIYPDVCGPGCCRNSRCNCQSKRQ